MQFGYMNLFQVDEGRTESGVLQRFLDEVRLADELGYDSVWLAEHHFSHYGIVGNPLLMGAAIAQRTKRIKIGTAVLVLPFHHPLKLAEDIATLDVLSEGRVVIGCGRGYQPLEFGGFGLDPNEARSRYDETVDILMLALAQENWSYEGKHYQFKNVTTYPRPYQPGGPKLLHGAVNPQSFEHLGSLGRRVITSPTVAPIERMERNFSLYRNALTAAGHDPRDFQFPIMQSIWTGRNDDTLRDVGAAALKFRRYVSGFLPDEKTATDAEKTRYAKIQENYRKMTIEQLLTHGGNFGYPEPVAELIVKLAQHLGVNEYIGLFTIPNLDHKVALKAMECFAQEVIPMVRAELASRPVTDSPVSSAPVAG